MTVEEIRDTLVSHNHRIAIDIIDEDPHYYKTIWMGMFHECPVKYLKCSIKRLFCSIPESIFDADVMHIHVEVVK